MLLRGLSYIALWGSTAVFHLHMWSYTCTQISIENYCIVNPDSSNSDLCISLFQAMYEVYTA